MDGKTLQQLRARLGWSQARLADEVGVATNTVARWERGELGIGEPAARLVRRIVAEQAASKRR